MNSIREKGSAASNFLCLEHLRFQEGPQIKDPCRMNMVALIIRIGFEGSILYHNIYIYIYTVTIATSPRKSVTKWLTLPMKPEGTALKGEGRGGYEKIPPQ